MSKVTLNSLVLQPLIGILYQLQKMEKKKKKEYGASVEGQITKKNWSAQINPVPGSLALHKSLVIEARPAWLEDGY